MPAIALLDPSLPGENETGSDNLGDVIIADATKSILAGIFPAHEIIRFPTKRTLSPKELRALARCSHRFLGGTNILNGDLKSYNQWKMDSSLIGIARPKFKGVIAMGAGWWQYQDKTTLRSKLFYWRVLNPEAYHSVRDHYSHVRIAACGIRNVLNTSCPTVWSLDGRSTRRRHLSSNALLFTLTDYMRSPDHDNELIRTLLEHSLGKLLFFPQGSKDIEYIESLSEFRGNRQRITLLSRDVREFESFANDSNVIYVGTRLHGGIRFLQRGRDALIICVDNRAAEIHKDIRLPAVARDDFSKVGAWLSGELDFGTISLPLHQIEQWKSQFAAYA